MTYTPEQARAMARAAVRWARDMWEASEEAIVARVLADAGAGQGGESAGLYVPPPPPDLLPTLRRELEHSLQVVPEYEQQAEWSARQITQVPEDDPDRGLYAANTAYCRQQAALYRWLAQVYQAALGGQDPQQARAAQGQGEAR